MAEDNIALVKRIYESGVWDDGGDPRDSLPWIATDFEYINPEHAVVPGVRHGHEGVVSAIESLAEGFSSWTNEPRAFHETGDKVLVETIFICVGAQSGLQFRHQEWHVWTVRDGLLQSLAWFHDRDAAREAAGL